MYKLRIRIPDPIDPKFKDPEHWYGSYLKGANQSN
jgi:hypothetical protein